MDHAGERESWQRPIWHLGHRTGPTYTGLLVLLLVNMGIQSATADDLLARVVSIVVSAAAVLIVLRAARTATSSGAGRLVTAVVWIATVISVIAAIADETADLGGWSRAISAGLYFAAAVGALVDVLRHPSVTGQTIAGALCVYLLLAYMFASVYATVNAVGSPFFAEVEEPGRGDFIYFSVITLTTVGYGDLTPAESVGRTFAGLEALGGQLFLVTFVAGFVGAFRRRGPLRGGESGPGV